MNLSFYIARRYLFSPKSHNAINVISAISVCGIAIATLAMVCTLSIFNGFTKIVEDSFSVIDPELQITPSKGKVFDLSDPAIVEVLNLPEIDIFSENVEENALVRYGDHQEAVLVKGVSDNFKKMAQTETFIIDGDFLLKEGDVDFGVVGVGVAMRLGLRAQNIAPLEIYAPKRDVRVQLANPSNAFTQVYAYPSGICSLNQAKYDEQILIISLEQARELFRYETEISSLDIKLKENTSIETVEKKIETILGDQYLVKNRFEQQESSFRMVNIEKWVTFLILAFILIIAVFNVVGSLSMLIVDKKADIKILQNIGASNKLITRIFLFEGWMISMAGAVVGLVLGVLLCLIQEHFGILKLGEKTGAFIIDAYPVSVLVSDVLFIFLTVSFIGFLIVLYPVYTLKKRLNSEI